MTTRKKAAARKTPAPLPEITAQEIMQAECILTSVECGGGVDDEELAIVLTALRKSLGQTLMPGASIELDAGGTIIYVKNQTDHKFRIEGSFFQGGTPTGYDLVISPHALEGSKRKK